MVLCRKALHRSVLAKCVSSFLEGLFMPEYSQRTKVGGKSHPTFKVKLIQNPKINSAHPVFMILFCNKYSIYSDLSLIQPFWLSFTIVERTVIHLVFINTWYHNIIFFFCLICTLQFCILFLYLHVFNCITTNLTLKKISEHFPLQSVFHLCLSIP